MRVRSIPSLVRTLAIFLASFHATGGGFGAVAGTPALAQPVLQTDGAHITSVHPADELTGQTLVFPTSGVSAPLQDGPDTRAAEGAPALAPAGPSTSKYQRAVHWTHDDRSGGDARSPSLRFVTCTAGAVVGPHAKAPCRIRAP